MVRLPIPSGWHVISINPFDLHPGRSNGVPAQRIGVLSIKRTSLIQFDECWCPPFIMSPFFNEELNVTSASENGRIIVLPAKIDRRQQLWQLNLRPPPSGMFSNVNEVIGHLRYVPVDLIGP